MNLGVRRLLLVLVAMTAGIAPAACGSALERVRSDGPAPGEIVDGGPPHPVASEPPAAALRAGERFQRLAMPRSYSPRPPAGGTDEYRCFLIDPRFTERTFVTGSQFVAGNPEIVHHAILFRVEPTDVAQAKRLDADAPGDGWTCFGGTGIGARAGPAGQLGAGTAWIAAWAPGAGETLLRAWTGYQMEAGSQIVMQVHYSLLGTAGGPAGSDRSGVRLRLVAGTSDLDPLQVTLVPAPVELPCAPRESGRLCDRTAAVSDVRDRFGVRAAALVAGLNLLCDGGRPPVPGPRQHCDLPVREAGVVHAVAGHMHLLGRSITVELNPGTPRARMLLDVPRYNFDDQGARVLPSPVAVRPGDTYRVTCTHDAALRGQLPQLRPLEPRYVVWGDGTSDEMCLGIVIWSRPPR